jgi:hypothetical protein
MKMLFPMVCLTLALSGTTMAAEPQALSSEKPSADTRSPPGQYAQLLYVGEEHLNSEGGQGLLEGCSDSDWAALGQYFRDNFPGCYATSCTPVGGGWIYYEGTCN